MATSTATLRLPARVEDVLSHLPVSSTTDYYKGDIIYGPGRGSQNIYMVVFGTVGISRIGRDSSEVLLEIVRPDDLFGESAFLEDADQCEQATALEQVRLMTWAVSDMEDLVARRPRLAVALLQILAQRNAEFTRRIESFATDTIEQRLARSLLHLSERMGTPEQDGSVRLMPFTHSLLSRYVGTSREAITQYMNRFRKQGYVNYSRRCIFLYRDNLKTVLFSSPSSTGASA